MPPPDDGRKAFDELAGLGLLTVCAASGDRRQSERRRHDYPEAAAEDMEGFGVAMSCVLAGIPLRIIRGISNVAGNRNASQWKIGDALTAVAERLGTLLAEDRGGTTGLDTPNKKGTE
jgi:futalosine hydrolase